MNQIVEFSVNGLGRVTVKLNTGQVRLATPREAFKILRKTPDLGLNIGWRRMLQ